ncbi:MAG: ATP-binding protein [Candidatus Methanoperedens sp.]|nr:ATP-binding protein [Candidatus Methanoperedens sp.]
MKSYPMSLRKKTLLIIGISLFFLIALLYFISSAVVLNSFSKVEKQDTIKNVNRVNDALSDEIYVLSGVVGDWAAWNETYTFVNGENPKFVEEQIADTTFIEIRVNLMLFINSTGGIAYGSGFDLKNDTTMPIPEGMQEYLSADSILLRHHNTDSSITGIILLPEGPMLIASRPILKSDGTGPIRGSVIWGRYLDDEEIKMIGTKTHLNITMQRLYDTKLPSDFLSVRDSFSENEAIVVRPFNVKSIAGYTILNDVRGAPALMMRVDMPRDIFNQGQMGMRYLLISLIVLGLVFGVLTLWLLDKLIISRLSRLNSEVIGISTTKELSQRVAAEGGDELSSLSGSINKMLEALEISEKEQRRAEEERKKFEDIRLDNEVLINAGKVKAELLAIMSHELRTPLNAVIGFSELMKGDAIGELNENQKRYMEKILTGGINLLSLVNRILELSRVEVGKIELFIEKMSVPATINDTLTMFKEKAMKHNILINTDLDPQLDEIETDVQKFKHILFNLLGNAIKFSKPEGGTITIRTKKEGDMAEFTISDTGIGIKEEDMGRLFRIFEQLDSGIKRHYDGTGLGLAVSKKLVEIQGGRITAKSKYGEGSTFTFTLPLAIKKENVQN